MMKRLTLGLATALYAAPVLAGPFGLNQGTPLSELDIKQTSHDGNAYVLSSVPKPYSLFKTYAAQVGHKNGLCMIRAATNAYTDDRYGINVLSDFHKTRIQLEKTYGAGRLFDELKPNALWDEMDEWVMSIRQNERSYQLAWSSTSGFKGKDGITEILLTVDALDSSTSYFSVQYRFANYEQCEAEIDKIEGDVL